MTFPLEVVVDGKKDSTCRIHIKYADNVDLKTKTDDLDGMILKSYVVFKKKIASWWQQGLDLG